MGGWDRPGPGNDYTQETSIAGMVLSVAGYVAVLLVVWFVVVPALSWFFS